MKKLLILAFQFFHFILVIQAQSGNVGVNTLIPQGTLHVVRNAPSGGTADALFDYSLDISGHQYVIGSLVGNNTKGAVSFGELY